MSKDLPIHVESLVKRFGSFTALNGLDLTVAPGEVHGFLGPNGAGKSTTIRVLLGLYRIDGGAVRVLGKDPACESAVINRRVSYVPGEVVLWPNLTGGQALDALAGLRGARDRDREEELIKAFDLDPSKKVRTYSKGNRQKVALVGALSAPTELLILDEPTSGLDPLMEKVFTDQVRLLAEQGRTVLLSSHILAEVQNLCSAVTIIKAGKVVEHGDLATLRRLSLTRVELVPDEVSHVQVCTELENLGVQVTVAADHLSTQVAADWVPEVLGVAVRHRVKQVTCEPASLEDLFLSHYEEQK